MAHRINVILDDAVWEQLKEVHKGDRSRLINQVVSEALLRRRRKEAFARIRERSKSMEPLGISAEELVRQDRLRDWQ